MAAFQHIVQGMDNIFKFSGIRFISFVYHYRMVGQLSEHRESLQQLYLFLCVSTIVHTAQEVCCGKRT